MKTERRKADKHEMGTLPARLVIGAVAGLGIAALIGGIGLSAYVFWKGDTVLASGIAIITALIGLANSCVTGLIGLLGRTSPAPNPESPQNVTVTNPPESPANVTEVPAEAGENVGSE